MIHSQNVLAPVMLATHLNVGSMTFCNLFEGGNKTEEYLGMFPFGKVPAMKDGSLCIAESMAIIRYLAMKYQPSFYPIASDLQACAQIDYAMDAMSSEVYPLWSDVVYVRCGFKPAPADQAAACESLNKIIGTWLSTFLADGKFVCGEQLTIADFRAVPFLLPLTHGAFKKVGFEFAHTDKVTAYVNAFMAAVPSAGVMKSAGGHSIMEFLDGLPA